MSSTPARHRASIVALPLLALLLSACELRRDGTDADTPPPEEIASSVPNETATPAASILRDENAPENDIELPPEPVELTIPFAGSGDLDAAAERLLANVLNSRAMEQDWPIVLAGHTDSAGNDAANLRVSRAKAEAVAAWLVERGVDDDRITVIAFGEQNPVAPNALPDGSPNTEGRRANRRVELRIAPPAPAETQAAEQSPTEAAAPSE